MNFIVNAWLDKPKPELQLVEKSSGQIVASWTGRRLQDLFASGIISYEELLSASQSNMKKVIKCLMLQVTCEELCGRCLYSS